MRTRSQARKRRQQQVRQTSVESPNLEKPNNNPPIVTMDDNRTMAQLLEAPTEGYEDAIVVPEITANNFEIKHGLLNLVQNKQFFGHDKEDPHAHIRYFNKITSTMKFPNVPSTSVKLMLFPFSLEGAARIWLEKEPPRSILTWDDLAWDRFNDLLRGCPHHGFSELHQLDTFYNSLNSNDQDSLNSAAGGNFLDKMPRECLKIIESKSKVRQSRSKAIVSKVSTSSSTSVVSSDIAELKDMVRALILDKKNQTSSHRPVKTSSKVVKLAGCHSTKSCPATDCNIYVTISKNTCHNRRFTTTKGMPVTDLRKLLNDKDKMIELTKTPVNKNCSAVILKKFPEKLGDPDRFLIPCDFEDKQFTTPPSIAEEVFVKVGNVLLSCQFMVVDYVADPRVPLILGRPFLRTARALIDVHGEQMTLRHDDQSVTFKVEVLEISESGNPTSTSDLMIDSRSPSFTPFGGSDFLMEEIDEFLEHDDSIPPGVEGIYDSEGDTIPIDPLDQEKTTFTCPYGTFAYRRMPFGLCNAPGTFQSMPKARLLRWILLLKNLMSLSMSQKEAENLAADHLSDLKIPDQSALEKKEITETFPLETLGWLLFVVIDSTPWFADFAKLPTVEFRD
ncbi:reverse transcriptase domain-containing protein [Tanacetum coccineum]